MKLTEEIINELALLSIEEMASTVYDYSDDSKTLEADLGYICGICEFTEELKKKLDECEHDCDNENTKD